MGSDSFVERRNVFEHFGVYIVAQPPGTFFFFCGSTVVNHLYDNLAPAANKHYQSNWVYSTLQKKY